MYRTCFIESKSALALLVLALALMVPAWSDAKNLYVNGATGNDAVLYDANSEATPWRTIGRAAWGSTNREARNGSQAARAGDVVLVAAGTYATAGTNSRNAVAYHAENSGTAGNPVIFRAVGLVQLTLSSGIGSVIGSSGKNYITWDGFTLHEASAPSAPDTGPATIFDCTGCVLQNLDINGNGDANNRADNHNGIRIERSNGVLIRNNRIQNVYSGTGINVNNGSAIMVYGSGAVTFEHNEIFNCGSGIFLKGGPNTNIDYFTIRYNLLYNIGDAARGGSAIIMHAGAATTADRPTRIYQNIVRDSREAAIRIWRFSDTDITNTPMHGKIVNNTFYNMPKGLWVDNQPLPNAGFVFKNNIVSNTSEGGIAFNGVPNDKSRFDSENNLFWAYGSMALTTNATHTLSNWKSTFGQDNAAPASVNVDPRFVNVGGRDLRLAADSAARVLGRDVFDLNGNGSTTDLVPSGAYVTGNEVIGRTTALPSPGMPTAPANLRIIPPAQ